MTNLRARLPFARRDAEIGDWRRRMSNNIAYALLVYTALQIFMTVGSLHAEGGSLLPYVVLVILVGAIIPACRGIDKRWNRLTDAQAHDPALAGAYARDRKVVWLMAIGLPVAITLMFRVLALIFLR